MEYGRKLSPNPRGTALSRYLVALALSNGSRMAFRALAAGWPDTPEVAHVAKSQVDAISIAGSGQALINAGIATQLIEEVRAVSILGKLEAKFRRVPFLVKVARENSNASSSWHSENEAIPVATLSLDSLSIEQFSSSTIIIISQELARLSTPPAEAEIRNSLARGIARHFDAQFLDPAVGRSAGKNPASVANGAPVIASTGNTAAEIHEDLLAMVAALGSFETPLWIMKPSTAIFLAGLYNGGGLQYPQITYAGGMLLGIPVVTSINAPQRITLLDASDILYADDGAVEIDVVEQAALVMSTTPEQSPMSTALVSLWQRGLAGIKVSRTVSWLRGHDGSVVSMQVSY